LIIPIVWEILIGFISAITVFFKFHFKKVKEDISFYPKVSILVPVYNSQKTLEACLDSIFRQDYPKENIEILLIDNGVKDKSYDIFVEFQAKHPQSKIWWHTSGQGKSKALNKGIFSSEGKYIINIDSDGCLDGQAIKNIVRRFESNGEIICVSGVVLIDPELIKNTRGRSLRLVQLCELFEYTESFLVGRNFQSIFNTIYTIAGAFSCFKREALLKTQMYNSETLGEDAHMTFQIKELVSGRLDMCEDAFFYVDPIESLDKIYLQRQRWQRAELEVASLFTKQHIGGVVDFITKPAVRILVSDHTLVFPRLIWFFAVFYLYFINYPLSLLIGANVLLYIAYVTNSAIYLFVSGLYLKKQEKVRKYLYKNWYICFLLPIYRFIIYWVRVAGIVNSLKTESKWRTRSFSEEVGMVKKSVFDQIRLRFPVFDAIKRFINNE